MVALLLCEFELWPLTPSEHFWEALTDSNAGVYVTAMPNSATSRDPVSLVFSNSITWNRGLVVSFVSFTRSIVMLHLSR